MRRMDVCAGLVGTLVFQATAFVVARHFSGTVHGAGECAPVREPGRG